MKRRLGLVFLSVLLIGCSLAPSEPSELASPESSPEMTSAVTMPTPTAVASEATSAPETPSASATPVPTAEPGASPTLAPPTMAPPTMGPPTEVPATQAPPTQPPADPVVEVWASGLEVPWGMAFIGPDRALVTERPGRLRLVVAGNVQPEPLLDLSAALTGEGGLMGIALHPDFQQNQQFYLMYTYRQGTRLLNRISRFTLSNDAATDERVLLDNIPGAPIHDGGRLAIGPDGKLYATTGDAGSRALAQQQDSLAGKILRMELDGSVPADNPFPGSLIYTLGHRNPQGLAWDPATGEMYETEHGPSGEMGLCCRDELNHIVAGSNYGWPEVTLSAGDPRFVDPILASGANTTWAPASAAVYRASLLPQWQGNLFFGALRGQHLHRVVLSSEGEPRVIEDEQLYQGEYGRIRTVLVGSDGTLYFMTSNRDGRGNPAPQDDRILRIVPG